MDALANFAFSTVTVPPSPATSGTSVTLADASEFPDPATDGTYSLVVWPSNSGASAANAEIVRVTAKASNVLTIVREQEGTSARAILGGDRVAQTVTKGLLESLSPVHEIVAAYADDDTPIDISSDTLPILGGYQVVAGDRILHSKSTNGDPLLARVEAGIRIAPDTGGVWERAADWADGQIKQPGRDFVPVGPAGEILYNLLIGVVGVYQAAVTDYLAPIVVGTDPANLSQSAIFIPGNVFGLYENDQSPILWEAYGGGFWVNLDGAGTFKVGFVGGDSKVLEITPSIEVGFFGATPSSQPVVPLTSPDVQDVIDALVALGLVAQAD